MVLIKLNQLGLNYENLYDVANFKLVLNVFCAFLLYLINYRCHVGFVLKSSIVCLIKSSLDLSSSLFKVKSLIRKSL